MNGFALYGNTQCFAKSECNTNAYPTAKRAIRATKKRGLCLIHASEALGIARYHR